MSLFGRPVNFFRGLGRRGQVALKAAPARARAAASGATTWAQRTGTGVASRATATVNGLSPRARTALLYGMAGGAAGGFSSGVSGDGHGMRDIAVGAALGAGLGAAFPRGARRGRWAMPGRPTGPGAAYTNAHTLPNGPSVRGLLGQGVPEWPALGRGSAGDWAMPAMPAMPARQLGPGAAFYEGRNPMARWW